MGALDLVSSAFSDSLSLTISSFMALDAVNTATNDVISGGGFLAAIEDLTIMALQPMVGLIPIKTDQYTTTRAVETPESMVISNEARGKQFIVDSAAPHPRTWKIHGYITSLIPVFETGVVIKPTLLLQKQYLDNAADSRAPIQFKTVEGEFVDVLIQNLSISESPKTQNAFEINITLKEFCYMQAISVALGASVLAEGSKAAAASVPTFMTGVSTRFIAAAVIQPIAVGVVAFGDAALNGTTVNAGQTAAGFFNIPAKIFPIPLVDSAKTETGTGTGTSSVKEGQEPKEGEEEQEQGEEEQEQGEGEQEQGEGEQEQGEGEQEQGEGDQEEGEGDQEEGEGDQEEGAEPAPSAGNSLVVHIAADAEVEQTLPWTSAYLLGLVNSDGAYRLVIDTVCGTQSFRFDLTWNYTLAQEYSALEQVLEGIRAQTNLVNLAQSRVDAEWTIASGSVFTPDDLRGLLAEYTASYDVLLNFKETVINTLQNAINNGSEAGAADITAWLRKTDGVLARLAGQAWAQNGIAEMKAVYKQFLILRDLLDDPPAGGLIAYLACEPETTPDLTEVLRRINQTRLALQTKYDRLDRLFQNLFWRCVVYAEALGTARSFIVRPNVRNFPLDSRYNIAVIGAAMQSNGCVGFAQLADTAFLVEIL